MISLSPIKILVIVAVVLLLLGPDKLPEVAHKLGSSWRALKQIQERIESEVRQAMPDLPSTADIARMARSPVNLLNQLADKVDARDAKASESTKPPDPPPRPRLTPTESVVRRVVQTPTPPDPSLN